MIKLSKLEDLYFNISSLILRWEPSEKKDKNMFCSVYVGRVYEMQSWTVVLHEGMGVDCEIYLNRESMFAIMAISESDLHTNFENIPTQS